MANAATGLGDLANGLVQDTLRSQQTNLLRPYADATVRSLARETRSLHEALTAGQAVFSQIESDEGAICGLLVSALSMRRDKRALLIYHAQRREKLQDLFWAAGGQISTVLGQESEERKNMTPAEVDFLRGYAKLSIDYRSVYSAINLDLTSPVMGRPPKALFVQVRVLKDIGEVETEWGTVSFTKDSLVYVRRPDVERLILGGYLEVVG